jgi:hypothetical protein
LVGPRTDLDDMLIGKFLTLPGLVIRIHNLLALSHNQLHMETLPERTL